MAEEAIISEDVTDGATVHSAANGINEVKLKAFVSSIEEEEHAIRLILEEAEAKCQPHRDEIKQIYKDAAIAGVPKEPMKAKMRERKLDYKRNHVTDGLNDRQKAVYQELTEKLGDHPLFEFTAAAE